MKNQRTRSALVTLLALPVLMTQAAPADYQSTVLADGPKAYYRFNDDTSRSVTNGNSGTLGAAGNLTNTPNVKSIPGAIAGSSNRARFFDTGSSYGMIPFNAALNPDNTQPFTIEVWFYPATDQINTGMCPINNRVSSGFPDRSGWVFFQRAPNADYTGKSGFEGVGWNCRMYRGSGSSSGLDVVSQVPFEVGKWTHVVVVYDPVQVTNASLTMYVNGVAANTNVWAGGPSGTDPGYAANPAVTDAALCLGAYNNTSGAGGNSFFGGADEFAFYSAKLNPAQILAHYQNGTNANRATAYETLIQSANPVVHLRLNERTPTGDIALNLGDERNNGIATHTAEVRHPVASALGRVRVENDDSAAGYHSRNGRAVTTMPWLAGTNPSAGVPFTLEAWLRPMRDQQGGQSPMANRMAASGGARTGWVMYQRFPNNSYASIPGINNEGHGWGFRTYNGVNTSTGSTLNTGTDYTVGKWQHLVITWEPLTQNGDLGGNGNDQWQGTFTAYVDGVYAAQITDAIYAANRQTPEAGQNGDVPADFAIGAYNAASTLGSNPWEGDADEVAFYSNYVLTPDQILTHYAAGTNANSGTNYESLVLMSPYDGSGTQRLGPKTYLRFNDAAFFGAANSGTLGDTTDGNLVMSTNTAAGPQAPAFAGFEASNAALALDGVKQWASANNPSGLNISGQITLEAWVKPAATQPNDPARILSHGTPTISDYIMTTAGDGHAPADGSVTNSPEVFLRIEGGANYVVGSQVTTYTNNLEIGTSSYTASFPIPVGDLTGSWVHLVGTYDGSKWRLYRNGAEVASSTSAVGALPVVNGDWAIGSTGNGWANNFAGVVDEPAIYSTALTPIQVARHYVSGKAGTTALTILPAAAGNVTITWPAGTTLVESSTVNGTYSPVGGSPVSPLTISASGTKFYGWRLP